MGRPRPRQWFLPPSQDDRWGTDLGIGHWLIFFRFDCTCFDGLEKVLALLHRGKVDEWYNIGHQLFFQ